MENQASATAKHFSKLLRRDMTDGERLLWSKLRGEQTGFKFRRQHPLGNYVADFVCLAPKLVVEIDGSQHAEQQAYDERRAQFFRRQEFEVMRFAANAPFIELQAVAEAIYLRLVDLKAAAPIPAFPQRGKEQETEENIKGNQP